MARNSSARSLVPIIALIATLSLASCSGDGDDDTAGDPPAATAPADDSGTSDDSGDDAGYASTDGGTGTATVAGTDYANLEGQCQLSNGAAGAEVLEDPMAESTFVTIGVDNVNSGAGDFSVTSTSNSGFRILAPESGKGTWESISFAGPRSEFEYADLALMNFVGTTEDGSPVTMQVICSILKP